MPAHPDLVALLAGCRATTDDTPRLVLADWLDDHGDADRATFVRIQCELAQPTADTVRVAALRGVERELLVANWERWCGPMPRVLAESLAERYATSRAERFAARGLTDPRPPDVVRPDPLARDKPWAFVRGFLVLDLPLEDLRHPPFLAWMRSDHALWVDLVRPGRIPLRDFVRLDIPAELVGVLGVDVAPPPVHPPDSGVIDLAEWAAFLGSRNFAALRGLTLTAGTTTAEFLDALAAADVRRIVTLSVAECGLATDGLTRLLAAPWDRLSALDVSRNDLDPAAGRALAAASLGSLRSLVAYRNRLADAGVVALAESPLAETLTRLDLMNTGLGDRGVTALARSPVPGRVAGPQWNLSMNRIGNAGATAIAGCPGLARFRELVLRENVVGDAGAKAIAESAFAANLVYLDLWRNAVGDRGAKALAASDHLTRVQDLHLRENQLTAIGTAVLRARFVDRVKV